MNKKNSKKSFGDKPARPAKTSRDQSGPDEANEGGGRQMTSQSRPQRKLSEYGKQLQEKQKIKQMYGVREKQFKRLFDLASRQLDGSAGTNLLIILERRLDNTLYRLKMATTRAQARQVVGHGHVLVNGKKVKIPSYLISVNDVITLKDSVLAKEKFLETVVDKRLNVSIKVPEWLELNKDARKGVVLREPLRTDIQTPIEEHLVVELYSK